MNRAVRRWPCLGDPDARRVLGLLAGGTATRGALAGATGMSPSRVGFRLSILRFAGLAEFAPGAVGHRATAITDEGRRALALLGDAAPAAIGPR